METEKDIYGEDIVKQSEKGIATLPRESAWGRFKTPGEIAMEEVEKLMKQKVNDDKLILKAINQSTEALSLVKGMEAELETLKTLLSKYISSNMDLVDEICKKLSALEKGKQ